MMDDVSVNVMKQLAEYKEAALAQGVNFFPARFYLFAELCLTASLFKALIDQIHKDAQSDHSDYDKIGRAVSKLMNSVYRLIINYSKRAEVSNVVLDQLKKFPLIVDDHTVNIYISFGCIKRIVEDFRLNQYQHEKILVKILPKIASIQQLLNNLSDENHSIRRMEAIRVWGSFQRIYRIYHTYNPKIYRALRLDLLNARRNVDLLTLDVQYAGLQRCIDPESTEKHCYDESFGMEADKLAIKGVYAYIERKIGLMKVVFNEKKELSSYKKLKLSKKASAVNISYDGRNIVIGSKSEEKKGNKRIKFAALFITKPKARITGRQAYNAISDLVSGCGGLSPDELKAVENTKNDFNRFLKNELGVETVVKSKSVDRSCGRIEFFINHKYL